MAKRARPFGEDDLRRTVNCITAEQEARRADNHFKPDLPGSMARECDNSGALRDLIAFIDHCGEAAFKDRLYTVPKAAVVGLLRN